ncbi:MAG: tetratricopeptide repeat protein [Candidatus Aminicenantales bacterium]
MAEPSKTKKGDYQKALTAYSQAMRLFHKRQYSGAAAKLKVLLEKFSKEKEIADRAQIYLAICQERGKKETIQLKTFDDYYQYSVYKINQGDYKEALKYLSKAYQMQPKEGKILYLMADAYCLMGNKDECLEYLKKAIQTDKYFRILAQNESDFASLREDKKFKLITRLV